MLGRPLIFHKLLHLFVELIRPNIVSDLFVLLAKVGSERPENHLQSFQHGSNLHNVSQVKLISFSSEEMLPYQLLQPQWIVLPNLLQFMVKDCLSDVEGHILFLRYELPDGSLELCDAGGELGGGRVSNSTRLGHGSPTVPQAFLPGEARQLSGEFFSGKILLIDLLCSLHHLPKHEFRFLIRLHDPLELVLLVNCSLPLQRLKKLLSFLWRVYLRLYQIHLIDFLFRLFYRVIDSCVIPQPLSIFRRWH